MDRFPGQLVTLSGPFFDSVDEDGRTFIDYLEPGSIGLVVARFGATRVVVLVSGPRLITTQTCWFKLATALV